MSPTDPASVDFGEQLARSGKRFAAANVSAIYCVHGTFVGNDFLGLISELSRFAPGVSRWLSGCGKRVVDLFTGEAGNYTRRFATDLEIGLSAGAGRTIPVALFHWSSQNNHIARADGAVRLIDELARTAENSNVAEPGRILLWGHSHGGNVLALVTQLLGATAQARAQFFEATRSYYQAWVRQGIDMPAWQRVRDLLNDADHPMRHLQLDIVTFGTPIRYGWNAVGYDNLLHFVHHRPPPLGEEYLAPIPLKALRALRAKDGDYVQQIGIAGTNFIPLPIAVRTLLADRRLHELLQHDIPREAIVPRLYQRLRVPDEGTTLLVDYSKVDWRPHRHLFGHALYTRRKWLPFHCGEIAERFYGEM